MVNYLTFHIKILMFSGETVEQAIIRLYKKGKTKRRIRKELKCGAERINRAIKYYQFSDQIPSPLKTGRPTKSNTEVLSKITLLTTEKRSISAKEISNQFWNKDKIQISPTSINRYRKELKFNYSPPKIKQELTSEQIEKRKFFSYSILNHSNFIKDLNLSQIIFSDESRFCLNNDNQFIWFRKNENTDDVFQKKSKVNQGVMVFGAIGYNFKSPLIICENSIDEIEYREILSKCSLFEKLDGIYQPGGYIFMQDSAPAHVSYLSKLFLRKRCNFIKYWPPNSPDLNPIEHLWGAMKRLLKGQIFDSKKVLIENILEIWDSFPQDSINRLIESFESRIKLVIENNGNSISDILRSGLNYHTNAEIQLDEKYSNLSYNDLIDKYDPSVNDRPLEFLTKRKYSQEENLLLFQLVSTKGTRWKEFVKYFEFRTSDSLRKQFNRIMKLH